MPLSPTLGLEAVMVERCSVLDLRERLARGDVRLVDVRELPEWAAGHVEGAMHLPLGDLRARPERAGSGEVLLLCRSGRRAEQAAEALAAAATDVRPVVVDGGVDAWLRAGLPVRRERGPISLERQVRIAAGALVLAGLLIPGAGFLPYVVGAGLVFAGVTDTCAMGMLLARLPWNRRRPAPAAG
jgi:rhodanese-related sulfurtransferase